MLLFNQAEAKLIRLDYLKKTTLKHYFINSSSLFSLRACQYTLQGPGRLVSLCRYDHIIQNGTHLPTCSWYTKHDVTTAHDINNIVTCNNVIPFCH